MIEAGCRGKTMRHIVSSEGAGMADMFFLVDILHGDLGDEWN